MEKLHKGLAGQGNRNRVNFFLQRYYQSTESNCEDDESGMSAHYILVAAITL